MHISKYLALCFISLAIGCGGFSQIIETPLDDRSDEITQTTKPVRDPFTKLSPDEWLDHPDDIVSLNAITAITRTSPKADAALANVLKNATLGFRAVEALPLLRLALAIPDARIATAICADIESIDNQDLRDFANVDHLRRFCSGIPDPDAKGPVARKAAAYLNSWRTRNTEDAKTGTREISGAGGNQPIDFERMPYDLSTEEGKDAFFVGFLAQLAGYTDLVVTGSLPAIHSEELIQAYNKAYDLMSDNDTLANRN